MMTSWLSVCFAVSVPALVVACSDASGSSLTDYVEPSAVEAGDASTGSSGSSTAPSVVTTTPTVTTTSSGDAGSTDGGAAGSSADAASDASSTTSCPYTGTPLPTSGFPACGAVCAPTALVPASSQADFATCKTGLCVPTKVLAAYGSYLPKTCTSLQGAEGRCLNQVLPSVVPQVSELPQDVCDSDESCVPCYDPLDGTSTGACATVSCDSPKKPEVTFAGCCYWENQPGGKCVPGSAAGSAASGLSTDVCTGGDVCAPTENLEPTFQPTWCSNDDNFFHSYTGFCVSYCIPEADGLGQGSCDGAHYCAPCHDPLSGDPTNVPGCVY